MRLVRDPVFGEVDLTASEEELNRLASMVVRGVGLLVAMCSPGSDALSGVEVVDDSGPGVRLHIDSTRGVLVISGDRATRRVFADNLHTVASAEDGGHLHIDYFPGHPYLAEESVSLVVSSPHGGRPRR